MEDHYRGNPATQIPRHIFLFFDTKLWRKALRAVTHLFVFSGACPAVITGILRRLIGSCVFSKFRGLGAHIQIRVLFFFFFVMVCHHVTSLQGHSVNAVF